MKMRYLAFVVILVILMATLAIAPETRQKSTLDGIRMKASEIMSERMPCWDSAMELKSYLDSANVTNSIVTCEVNICQNVEPDVFYSLEHKEMGYFYNGTWFSENDCLRGHVINSFEYHNETLYIDSTRSDQPARNSSVVLACFRY